MLGIEQTWQNCAAVAVGQHVAMVRKRERKDKKEICILLNKPPSCERSCEHCVLSTLEQGPFIYTRTLTFDMMGHEPLGASSTVQ